MSQAKDMTLHNAGRARVVIGRGARSAGEAAGTIIKFDTPADEKVPAANRLGQLHTVTGADATRLRTSKVFAAVGPKLGLTVR